MDNIDKLIMKEYGSVNNYIKLKTQDRKPRSDRGHNRKRYDSKLSSKFKSYLQRANKKGICMELTEDQFIMLTRLECTYCGQSNCGGVDRIDSSIGYTIDNSVPCCFKCNMMKYTHSSDDFLNHVKKIYNHCVNKY